MGVRTGLAAAWARGVAANPAASTNVLMRLLDPAGRPAWDVLCGGRALPEEVVAAIVTGSEVSQRRLLARNAYATPEQRGRLASDPEAMVRHDVARGPQHGTWLVQPLPDDALEAFFTAKEDDFPPGLLTVQEIEQDLLFSGQVPLRYYRALVTHPDPTMRRRAARSWELLTPEQQAALLADPVPLVREAAEDQAGWQDPVANEARLPDHWTHGRTHMMMHRPMTHAVAERELADEHGRGTLAHNRFTPADIVERLAGDPDPGIRATVAARFGLPPAIRARLEQDPDEDVRTTAAAFGAATTKAQHSTLLRNMPGGSAWPPRQDASSFDLGDPEWYARAAESGNVLLRRAAARDPRLPSAQVSRLASDADPRVRSLLAHNHPDAPPELMIEVFLAEPDKRTLLLSLPQMPRTGLAHLLEHPEPRLRALAAADGTLPEPPVAQLDDESELVRRAAAANALLPADVVYRLLQDPRHAEGAAANPRLDAEAQHGLLDAAGIPRLIAGEPRLANHDH